MLFKVALPPTHADMQVVDSFGAPFAGSRLLWIQSLALVLAPVVLVLAPVVLLPLEVMGAWESLASDAQENGTPLGPAVARPAFLPMLAESHWQHGHHDVGWLRADRLVLQLLAGSHWQQRPTRQPQRHDSSTDPLPGGQLIITLPYILND